MALTATVPPVTYVVGIPPTRLSEDMGNVRVCKTNTLITMLCVLLTTLSPCPKQSAQKKVLESQVTR